jgi:hypothetical protein
MGGIANGTQRELRVFPFYVARCSVGRPQFGPPALSIKPMSPPGSTFLCGEMQPAMLLLHLFCSNNSAAKVCQLHKLMLDCL